MRAYFAEYEMISARDLPDALALLEKEPGVWQPFAGGTDLMVVFETGALKHRKYLNIWNLNELRGITEDATHVTLGALVTYSEVQASQLMRVHYPLLCRAARETGAIAIQNRGTIGGNIVNASPAADSPPALLAYDAEVELSSRSGGARWIPYAEFHLAYKKTQLKPQELLTKVRLPRYAGKREHYYRKVGTRKAQAISKVCFAGVLEKSGSSAAAGAAIAHVRIGLGSVAPIPVRCKKTEEFLTGQPLTDAVIGLKVVSKAREIFLKEISPIDDIRSTRAYRNQVAANLLGDFLSPPERP